MELVAAATDLHRLHRELLESAPEEGAAFLGVVPDNQRLLMRSYRVFGPDELDRSGGGVSVREEIKLQELAALKRKNLALVDVHTHPGSGPSVRFSTFDEQELPDFARYVGRKLPDRPFGALVVSELGSSGSAWVSEQRVTLSVRAVGERAAIPAWADSSGESQLDTLNVSLYDRQIRCLGPEGQARLTALRVGVVGLGGTGSLVASELAHLGMRNVLLVDDDRVERSNLPRLAGASWWDAALGRKKTQVAKRAIHRVSPRAKVHTEASLRSHAALDAVCGMDLLIGCVDNDGARLMLTEVAAAYLVPYLDIGVSIESGESIQMGGRIAFFIPGEPCLSCMDEIDYTEAAEDLRSETERGIRRRRGYAPEQRIEPALMPLNTVLVGAGLLEVIAFATGVRPVVPFFRYDAIESRLVRQRGDRYVECPVCAPAFATGDRQQVHRYALS